MSYMTAIENQDTRITKGAAAPQKHNIVGTTCRTRLVISDKLYYKETTNRVK
jgi:hypothetical protein